MDNNSMKIVIVEDNPNNLKVLGTILRQEGFRISIAMNGEQGISVIEETMPDLILSDVRMPVMDGFEMCRHLKHKMKTRDIPLIFLTASNSTEDETEALEIGAIDFIAKPINPSVVIARVYTHLQLRHAMASLQRENELLLENSQLRDDLEQISRHDLKSPLQAVIAVPEMLLADPSISEENRELIILIKEAGDRMLEMINSSLDLYKMERHIYKLRPEPINLLPIFKTIDSNLATLRIEKKLLMKIRLNGEYIGRRDKVIVEGEELLFYSMFSNLVKNCYEAAPRETIVDVIFETSSEEVTLRLRNKGEVPEGIRTHFFEKYVTAGKVKGTGFGTYSAYLIAQTLGASISLDTSELGYTTITLQFLR